MVKIKVKHKFRKKTIEMDIPENTLIHAEKGYGWAVRSIFESYLQICHYQRGKLHPQSIKFWRVESKTPKQTFAHQTDTLSACEREYCSFCDNGQYDKCPVNRHKL